VPRVARFGGGKNAISLSRFSGIASQTILTIPISHVTNNQIVNLALSNGQVVSTTLANLQSLAQPQNMLNTPTSNGKSPASEKETQLTRSFRCAAQRRDIYSARLGAARLRAASPNLTPLPCILSSSLLKRRTLRICREIEARDLFRAAAILLSSLMLAFAIDV